MEDQRLELRLGLGPPGMPKSVPSPPNNISSNKGIEDQKIGGDRNWLDNSSSLTGNSAMPNSPHQRRAVVGWPPVRTYRKNIHATSSSSSKREAKEDENGGKCRQLLVKINMDGVPIGRKVDLFLHDDYNKLSSAVDLLFRDLLAAQRDPSMAIKRMKEMEENEEEEAITGVLDGSGVYTLVYEDTEGDRMLVGDVPWHMFVSTVKRLRVLRRSELSTLQLNGLKLKGPPARDE